MAVARSKLIERAALRLGGRAGTLTSTAGVSTAAVLNGLVDTTGDDSMFVGWHLFMLDAASEADRERVVLTWDDSTGTATFKARADTTWTGEDYILVADYSLDEFRQALNMALRQSKRSYRSVFPTVPSVRRYSLAGLSWLEGADDVDAVWTAGSPNLLHNEDFEFWQDGAASAPDSWTLAGASATVARSATGIRSPYGATVTRAGTDATLYQDIPSALVQYLTRAVDAPLPLVSFGAWVACATASIARVGVYNGSTTAWSSYHTGSGVLQFLQSTYQTTATDTALRLVFSVDTTNGAGTIHAGVLSREATVSDQLRDRGSHAYSEREVNALKRNVGGVPVIDLASAPAQGQIVVTSRRPFPEMDADTDTVEDQYADTLQAGLLRWLLDAVKPNQDRTRLDGIRGEEAAKWARALKKNIDKPVEKPLARALVGGA